ncbi:MAG: ribulose-phosphate 3-epimerase [bacterium]
MSKIIEIYPSLMCADLLNLAKVLSDLDAHCDGYHIDVMDDHFVPNLTMGPDFVNAIAVATRKPVQVHLMVDNPKCWVDRLNLSDKDAFIFHYDAFECFEPMKDLIDKVKAKGWKVGMAFNPHTNMSLAESHLSVFDKILMMAVNPGFAGQKFMPEVIEKVKNVIIFKKTQNANFKICLDGGIGKDNIKMLAELGIDAVAVGSAIFSEKNPVQALKELYEIAKPT